MKKLVFAVLAIGAMAACTKQNVQLEAQGEMTLSPVVQKATKAAVDGATYPTDETFNVWAWYGSDPAETSATTNFTTEYIVEGGFKKNGGTWAGWNGTAHSPYYWPTTGSLFFAGYSPASAKDSADSFAYNLQTKTLTVTNYVQSNVISETKDLMWFDATESYDQETAEDGVPAVFQHALSWLTFKFKLASGAPADNWKITQVELKGIENMSTFTATNGTGTWGTLTHNNVDNNDETNETNIVVYSGATSPTTEGVVLENTAGASVSVGAVLVIPQSCAYTNETTNDASLVITYNLKNPAYTVGSSTIPEWITGQTRTLPLNGTNVNNTWVTGKHYIYTITFGANEILIAPEVGTWADPVTQDINVQ